jgi:hypothetical protein
MNLHKGSDVHNHLSMHHKGFALVSTPSRPDPSFTKPTDPNDNLVVFPNPEPVSTRQPSALLAAASALLLPLD